MVSLRLHYVSDPALMMHYDALWWSLQRLHEIVAMGWNCNLSHHIIVFSQISWCTDPEKEENWREKRELLRSLEQVQAAMEDIEKLLHPPRCDTWRTYKDPRFDDKLEPLNWLEAMKTLCFHVIELESKNSKASGGWTRASVLQL